MQTRTIASACGLFFLFGFASFLAAQAPPLAIAAPIAETHASPKGAVAHVWKILLTNNYHAPVTAYAIRYNGGIAPNGGLRWDDSIPGSQGLYPALPPDQTASMTLPAHGSAPPIVENTAVIYSDGTTAGDPAVVAHFLKVRAVYLAELPPAIARLNAIALDPGADRAAVLAEFQQRQTAEKGLMDDSVRGPRLPRVSGTVVENLTLYPNKSLQTIAAGLAQSLLRWQGQLEHSQPRLATVAPPAN